MIGYTCQGASMKELRNYLCPFCNAHLNPREYIVLRCEFNDRRALVLLSPAPGDYGAIIANDFPLEPNDIVVFSCPVCSHELQSSRDPLMAELCFKSDDAAGTVVFSRITGHQATYFVSDSAVHCFGEHADANGVNFWGERSGK